jgi:hypothetical protein
MKTMLRRRMGVLAAQIGSEDLTCLKSGYIDEARFDKVVDPRKMVGHAWPKADGENGHRRSTNNRIVMKLKTQTR